MQFGDRVKVRRKQLHLTQDELALKMGYKHKASISYMESGRSDIPTEKLSELAQHLETTVDYLLGNTDDPEIPPAPVKKPTPTEADIKREMLHQLVDKMNQKEVEAVLTLYNKE